MSDLPGFGSNEEKASRVRQDGRRETGDGMVDLARPMLGGNAKFGRILVVRICSCEPVI